MTISPPTLPQSNRIEGNNLIRDPGDGANRPGAWPTLSRSADVTKRTCSLPECDEVHYGRGWCRLHYQRWFNHGSTDRPVRKRPTPPACSEGGCERPSAGQGLCSQHWHERQSQRITTRRRGHRAPSVADKTAIKGRLRCTSDGCAKRTVTKGLCSWHYQLARDARQPRCSVAGCESPERAKGLCPNHYAYLRRHGVTSPQFTCEGCGETFPGRKNTRHCVGCKPTPNYYAVERKARLAANNAGLSDSDHADAAEYRQIIKVDPCVYCGTPSVAIDHVTPIVDGGSDHWTNLAPACKPCNSKKRSRSVLTLMLERLSG